ncbi:MAG TPA: hypothetical protein VH969_30615 [Actinophytocola sp.]|jgi:hypothetical protein
MSKRQLAEPEVARTATADQPRPARPQPQAPADRSEDHLIRGYN